MVASRHDDKKPPLLPPQDDMKLTSCNTDKVLSADLIIFIDEQQVTALVNTGANFSKISQDIAVRLIKVKMP